MKILDRYLARQFLINFAILTAVLMTLYVLVDLIVDLDAFIDAGISRAGLSAEQAVPWWRVLWQTAGALLDYELPLMVLLYVTFAGLLTIGAIGFTFANIARSRELIAMLMGGSSLFRIAAPVLAAAGLLVAATLPIQEFVVPRLAGDLTRSKGSLKYEHGPTLDVTLVDDGQGNLFSSAGFKPKAGLLENLTILDCDAQGRLERRIVADRAVWDARRGGWRLEGAHVERAQRIVEPDDASKQPPVQAIEFFPTGLSPDVLLAARHAMYARLLSINQLLHLEHSEALETREIQMIMQGRLSGVVVNLLLLLLSIRFFLTREPVNMMVQGIKATAVLLPTWLIAMLTVTVGVQGLNPVASSWLAVVVLLPVVGGVLQTIRT